MPSTRIAFRIPEEIEAALGVSEGKLSERARECLARYFTGLTETRKELQARFAKAELATVAEVVNGVLFEAHTLPLLWANVDEACRRGLAQRHAIDSTVLVAKLRDLTYFETAALVDAAEWFWNMPEPEEAVYAGDLLER